MVEPGIFMAVAALVVRNLLGWANVALEDGEVTPYEWKSLATTVVRVGLLSAALFGWFNVVDWGVNVDVFASTLGAVVVDLIFSMWKRANIRSME